MSDAASPAVTGTEAVERASGQGALPIASEVPTVDLWPTAGRALGLGRSATYDAAGRGEIPGLLRIGAKYRVATATLRRTLGMDTGPGEAA